MAKRRKKKKSIVITSTESMADFLARGGKVTHVEQENKDDNRLVKSTISKPPKVMHLLDGAHYYAEPSKRKKKIIKKIIDINKIPEELKHLVDTTDDK